MRNDIVACPVERRNRFVEQTLKLDLLGKLMVKTIYTAAAFLALAVNSYGQDTPGKESQKKGVAKANKTGDEGILKESKKAFMEIGKLLKEEKWKEFQSRLTPDAADQFCFEQLTMMSISLEMDAMGGGIPDDLHGDLPGDFPGDEGFPGAEEFEMPDFKETKAKIDKVIKKHGLEDIVKKMDPSKFFEGGAEPEFDKKAILKMVDAKGDRWKIVADLIKAQKGSPFSFELMAGELKEGNVKDGVVYWQMIPKMPEIDGIDLGGPAGGVEMVVPPVIIRMSRTGMQWKFDGVDEEKSMKVAEEYFKEMDIPGVDGEFDLVPPGFGGPDFELPEGAVPDGIEIEDF